MEIKIEEIINTIKIEEQIFIYRDIIEEELLKYFDKDLHNKPVFKEREHQKTAITLKDISSKDFKDTKIVYDLYNKLNFYRQTVEKDSMLFSLHTMLENYLKCYNINIISHILSLRDLIETHIEYTIKENLKEWNVQVVRME